MHVGQIFYLIININYNFDPSNVSFLAVAIFTKSISVTIPPLSEFTSLVMLFLMNSVFHSRLPTFKSNIEIVTESSSLIHLMQDHPYIRPQPNASPSNLTHSLTSPYSIKSPTTPTYPNNSTASHPSYSLAQPTPSPRTELIHHSIHVSTSLSPNT